MLASSHSHSAGFEGMSDSVVPQYDRPPDKRSYSSNLRNLLFGAALLVALFPIPVTAFGLLPTYQQHARFLILYTPVICLLAVGYLFYLRDSLARLLFADLISFHPEDYEYQPDGARILGKLRSTIVALLPALLLLASFFCFTAYTKRFSQSLELTTAVLSVPAAVRDTPDPGGSHAPSRPTIPALSREEVLRTADIDSIEMFSQLTALYMGIFVSALMAIVVMALKEHAAHAMGLSEHAFLLGEWDEEEQRFDEESVLGPPSPMASPAPPASEPPSAHPAVPDMPPEEVAQVRATHTAAPNGTAHASPPPAPGPVYPSPPPRSIGPNEPPASSPPPPQVPHRRRYSMEPPKKE
jgi:hypothetical protein